MNDGRKRTYGGVDKLCAFLKNLVNVNFENSSVKMYNNVQKCTLFLKGGGGGGGGGGSALIFVRTQF